ncbi:MAG: vancomycin resistance histidine kinase VanS [Lachnospiraceae bacterium]|nr:vancomycin resistance histidine kinase VanS [Lachnospiraceae bacterium]
MMASVLSIWIFYLLFWQGRVSEWVVAIFQRILHMDYWRAAALYDAIFRDHLEFFLLFGIIIFFFVIFRFFLNWFPKYLNKINRGIDELLKENHEEIVLSPELGATEKRLNEVRRTLEKRGLEAQLAEQRKNDLVMYLAHDIKTPLTSVIGYLSLLDEISDMPEEQRTRYVHITLEKAYRMEKMINEFFEITRYNLQHIYLEKETIDLYYMLVQLTDELLPILSKNGNTTVLHADENLTIHADSEKLARVFNNILKNAAAYSYPDSEILISAEQVGDQIRISFKNKGKTIPREKLMSIFEKFYRLDEARTTNNGGTGLGLAIAKEIVSLHGGTITAESEHDIVEFIVTLPI